MVEVAAASDFSMSENMGGNDLRNPSMDLLNIHTNGAGMDDVDKLLQAFQPGERPAIGRLHGCHRLLARPEPIRRVTCTRYSCATPPP